MLRTIVAGLLIVTMTACTSWKPVLIRPETYIRMHDPEAVWVQLQDNSTLVLGRPRVFLDTLRGTHAGEYRNIPLKDVVKLRAEEPDRRKTALLVSAGAVFAAAFLYLATHSDRTQP